MRRGPNRLSSRARDAVGITKSGTFPRCFDGVLPKQPQGNNYYVTGLTPEEIQQWYVRVGVARGKAVLKENADRLRTRRRA